MASAKRCRRSTKGARLGEVVMERGELLPVPPAPSEEEPRRGVDVSRLRLDSGRGQQQCGPRHQEPCPCFHGTLPVCGLWPLSMCRASERRKVVETSSTTNSIRFPRC